MRAKCTNHKRDVGKRCSGIPDSIDTKLFNPTGVEKTEQQKIFSKTLEDSSSFFSSKMFNRGKCRRSPYQHVRVPSDIEGLRMVTQVSLCLAKEALWFPGLITGCADLQSLLFVPVLCEPWKNLRLPPDLPLHPHHPLWDQTDSRGHTGR